MTAQAELPPQVVLATHVGATAERLQSARLDPGHHEHALATAQLARLRRARIADPSDPSVWDVVFADLPTVLAGRGAEASRAELAAYSSLTLFGTHMQSATRSAHERGRRLGLAVGALARTRPEDQRGAIVRRFHTFATATSYAQRIVHLRSLVSLMRTADQPIALDYGHLAGDLYDLQRPDGLARVRLRWGRDFHARPRPLHPDAHDLSKES